MIPPSSQTNCAGTNCACRGDEQASRRQFLQRVSTITIGALSLTIFPSLAGEQAGAAATAGSAAGGAAQLPVYGFLVDTEKCIGAGKCLSACRLENNVPEGCHRTWVERYVHFKDGTVQVELVPETGYVAPESPAIDPESIERAYFVPKLCNHCEDAPCNAVCPVHASFTSPEGFELVDSERCIGCAYCVEACPYGVRFINPVTGTADKCTWCYHRVEREQSPACVEACPVGARVFGRLDDPNSEISQRITGIPTSVLKRHLGTGPKTQYAGISDEVI